jgi:biopolymer transport protein TolQ
MVELILGAGLIVKAVLLLLLGLSLVSWAVIAYKARELSGADRHTRAFLDVYRGQPLNHAYDISRRHEASPVACVFRSGYRDFGRLRKAHPTGAIPGDTVEGIVARLAGVQTDEGHRLERGLPFLATTGSSAPFIGLFGTVIGIMNAFRDIGISGSASLAVVAPGIAEALVATAVGLFAAIPAVIGYNYASARLARIQERTDVFRAEFAESLRRAANGRP